MICRLLKSLYGLKQATRQFYILLHDFLTNDLKFIRCMKEYCLYVKKVGEVLIIILVYLDDLTMFFGSLKFSDIHYPIFSSRGDLSLYDPLSVSSVRQGPQFPVDRSRH